MLLYALTIHSFSRLLIKNIRKFQIVSFIVDFKEGKCRMSKLPKYDRKQLLETTKNVQCLKIVENSEECFELVL